MTPPVNRACYNTKSQRQERIYMLPKKCLEDDKCSQKVEDKVYETSEAFTKWVEEIEEKLHSDEKSSAKHKSDRSANKRPEHIKDDTASSQFVWKRSSGDSEPTKYKDERNFMMDMIGNIVKEIHQKEEELKAKGIAYDIEDITTKVIDDMKAKGYGNKPAKNQQTKEGADQSDIQNQQTNDTDDKLSDGVKSIDNTNTAPVNDMVNIEDKTTKETQQPKKNKQAKMTNTKSDDKKSKTKKTKPKQTQQKEEPKEAKDKKSNTKRQ